MLAYAPRPTARSGSPRTLLLVAAGHVVALALVLTARSEFVARAPADPTDVVFIEPVKPPPPPPPTADPAPPRDPLQSTIDRPPVIIPTPALPSEALAEGPPVTVVDPRIGTAVEPPAIIPDLPTPAIVRKAARFITPADQVRPPYPASKQRLEQEASLRLALTIDARGRVTSVSPVGAADPIFLNAAQRHIVRHWRYQPASEGGEAVASRIVVTLKFTLED